jgi:hypothetical protein
MINGSTISGVKNYQKHASAGGTNKRVNKRKSRKMRAKHAKKARKRKLKEKKRRQETKRI